MDVLRFLRNPQGCGGIGRSTNYRASLRGRAITLTSCVARVHVFARFRNSRKTRSQCRSSCIDRRASKNPRESEEEVRHGDALNEAAIQGRVGRLEGEQSVLTADTRAGFRSAVDLCEANTGHTTWN